MPSNREQPSKIESYLDSMGLRQAVVGGTEQEIGVGGDRSYWILI